MFKFTKLVDVGNKEGDFKRIDSEDFQNFEAEGGSRSREDDVDAQEAESSFSLGSAIPAAPISPSK